MPSGAEPGCVDQILKRRREVNPAACTSDRQRRIGHESSYTGANRVAAARLTLQAHAQCSRKIGARPRFLRRVEYDGRVDGMPVVDDRVDPRRRVTGSTSCAVARRH